MWLTRTGCLRVSNRKDLQLASRTPWGYPGTESHTHLHLLFTQLNMYPICQYIPAPAHKYLDLRKAFFNYNYFC